MLAAVLTGPLEPCSWHTTLQLAAALSSEEVDFRSAWLVACERAHGMAGTLH
jgi:hypothetical protein